MTTMTDSRAVDLLAEVSSMLPTIHLHAERRAAIRHAIARLREPAGVGGEFDAEAVAWAYGKLRDFGCYTREAGAMMGDRLNMMLLDPPAAPQPPAEAQAQGGGEAKYDPAQGVYDAASLAAAGRYWDALEYELTAREDWSGDEHARVMRMSIAVERAMQAYQDSFAARTAPPSAPVGVADAALMARLDTIHQQVFGKPYPTEALAQQPAAENDDAEQLAACREDWQLVCKAIAPDGLHLNPDEVVEWIEKHKQPAADGGFTAADMMDARQEGRKEAQQPAAVDEDAAITRMCEAHYGVQFGYSKAARDKMRRLLTAALAQQPAAVDGAMVERAQIAWMRSDFVNVPGDSDDFDELVRLILHAALHPTATLAQPGGSDNDR